MKTTFEAEKKRIEREYSRLQKYFSQFTELKQSIAALVANAPTDPQAKRKLNQLGQLFPEGINGMEHHARQDMKTLSVALKKLKSRINHAVSNSAN
ncbi:type III secretion system chaperone SseA [Yersinia aldovae]|uniref:hypothetical protein n=1 Tax=Yersinia aldovae TaxID=29483 RepID=UPI0005E62D2F|nr:hypothetical protein [Yersinia aldovae]CNH68889.1 type III secretion system chaperone SseA [Yersinia aldovae]